MNEVNRVPLAHFIVLLTCTHLSRSLILFLSRARNIKIAKKFKKSAN